jgi:glycosyltransferase involved in cell wall biosynthesis
MLKEKICIIGVFGRRDEGLHNVNYHLTEELSKRAEVLAVEAREIFKKNFWIKIKDFKPSIIYYTCGPTIRSFFLVKILREYFKCRTVISAIHPKISFFSRWVIKLLKPDLILVQSAKTFEMFKNIGCRTEFLTNGVDINKFVPVAQDVKEQIRKKLNIDPLQWVVLHVGHLTKSRNLGILKRLQKDGNQVIVIASGCFKKNFKLAQQLKNSGCLILDGFFEEVEQIYAMADCYIFPVKKDSIQTPLSVLEAMSCNIAVITTKFSGLTSIFQEGDGLFFVDKEGDFFEALRKIKEKKAILRTREKIINYSWVKIGERLEDILAKMGQDNGKK